MFDDNFQDIAEAIARGILDTLSNIGDVREPFYRGQVGLYRNNMNANRLLEELLAQDFPAFVDNVGEYNRVLVGGYDDLNTAVAMEQRLRRAGYDTLIVS